MRSAAGRTCAACFALTLFISGCSHQSTVAISDAVRHDLAHPRDTELDAKLCSELAKTSGGRDCSSEFQERFAKFQDAGGAKLHDLSHYRVLVVHGLLGEVGLKFTHFLDRFDDDQHVIDYLKDHKQALEASGATVEVLQHKSDSVERGGAEVARRIAASDRPVLIVSHSKGCLDTLEALLGLQREGKLTNVAGWIAIQGPFAGAPEAEQIMTHQARRLGTRVALKVLGARFDAVTDMTFSARENYLRTNLNDIERLTARIPTLCFASWKEDAKRPGTDGSVPLDSAVLRGTEFVVARCVSRADTVMSRSGDFNRAALTRSLMDMLLERIAGKSETAKKNETAVAKHSATPPGSNSIGAGVPGVSAGYS